jgi:hypothetical protein
MLDRRHHFTTRHYQDRTVKHSSLAVLTARKAVDIGEGVDQHSRIIILAQSDVAIGHKIDHRSTAKVTSLQGSISVGRLSGEAIVTLTAPHGSITIATAVDPGSTARYEARSFNCPYVAGIVNQRQRR